MSSRSAAVGTARWMTASASVDTSAKSIAASARLISWTSMWMPESSMQMLCARLPSTRCTSGALRFATRLQGKRNVIKTATSRHGQGDMGRASRQQT
jgi:hypothetical protein